MTNQPIKILIVPSWYPTERYPMGGIFCREQAVALQASDEADVVVLFVDRAPVGEWLRGLRKNGRRGHPPLRNENGVRVYRTQMPRLPVVWPLLYVTWALLAARRLRRSGFKPDVLHAHVALPAGLAGVFLRRLTGVPLVL